MRSRVAPVFFVVLAVAVLALVTVPGRAGEETDDPLVRAALAQLGESCRQALQAEDAEAYSRCFTSDAEYVNERDEVYRGRNAIRSMAASFFRTMPGIRVAAEPLRFRTIGDDVACEETIVTLHSGDGAVLSRSRYSIVCVRRDEGWLIADLKKRELPAAVALSPREQLESLSWLVGDWVEETDEAKIKSSCRWSDDGPYLIQKFTVRDGEGNTSTSTQRIAWDPLLRKVRSWFWDSAGGYGGAIWSATTDGWVLQARSVAVDGTVRTGMHYVHRDGEDASRWEAKARIVGDVLVDDQTYFIVRQPPEPR